MTPTERLRRITDVCEFAAQLRPEQREIFLEGQCQGDEQLLQEVKAALSKSVKLGETAGGTAAAASGQPPEKSAAPTIKRIGRYEITGSIGSGGSGQVYSALDRTVGRVVAIKVLNAPGDPDLVRRFQAEAKTVANLHHKNIVTLHEFGEENNAPYLVMEYLNGTTLQELIRRDSLTLLEKLEIMSEVAEGLQYAHEHGITHRDVKPANIMRLSDGSVKIMDFGIARLGADASVRLTQSGLLIGSIMYMAPEQFSGTADALTDVFAYGVTFYELLTGKNPFAAADPVGIIFKIANTDPPPVSSEAPECPEALDRILRRTLAREREARYSSLSDVLADTRGILSDFRRDQAYRFYKEAERLFSAGDLDAAKSAVRKALKLDPVQEDARHLRSKIEEELRRRDALARAQSLTGQLEKLVQEQQWEDAAGILESIRELGVSDPQLQGRFDWAASQVDKGQRRDRLLNEAKRDLRKENLTAAFRAVSEVLASDPGNSSGKDLLQEIRNQMAATEARRRLEEEAARAEGLIMSGETDQALYILAEMERQNPDFAKASSLRARAEAQKAQAQSAQRLAEGTAEVNDLLNNGLFDMALAKIDKLSVDFPNNRLLESLRAQASERPAESRQDHIAAARSQAEALMARQEFDRAMSVLESAIARHGDDWDLTRLLLQATVARNEARDQAELAKQPRAPELEVAANDSAAAAEQWRDALGKLSLDAPPSAPTSTEPPPATPSPVPDQREMAIGEVLAKLSLLENKAQYTEAARIVSQALQDRGIDLRLIEAKQRIAENLARQQREEAVRRALALRKRGRFDDALQVLEASETGHPGDPAIADLMAQIRREREAAPRRKSALAIRVAAGAIALAIVILLVVVVRPRINIFKPAAEPTRPTGETKLRIGELAGSQAATRGGGFSMDLQASGGSPPLTWDVKEGDLPPGLSLNPGTGRIEGQPVKSGIYIFLMRISDSAGHSAERAITIEVVEPPGGTITTPENPAKLPANSGQPTASGTSSVPGAGASNPPLGGNSGSGGIAKGGATGPGGGTGVIPSTPNPNAGGIAKGGAKLPATGIAVPANPNPGGIANGGKAPDNGGVAIPANPNPNSGGVANGGKASDSSGAAIPANPVTATGRPMWSMDGGDQRRSGSAPYRGPRNPRILWSVEAGNIDQNSPLIGPDGRVYVWNARERMLRSVENGRLVWSIPLSQSEDVSFGPDGSIQLTAFPGRTRTLDRDGSVIRTGSADIRYLGLFVWRGHAYSSNGIRPEGSTSSTGVLFRADDRNWRVELDDQATRPVIDEDGVLYVGTNKGTLYAVSDAATILWSYATGAGLTRGLSVTRDRDILAVAGQTLFSVRAGQLQWKFKGDGDGNAFPPINDLTGTVYFGKGADFYAVTAPGKVLWRVKLGGAVTTAPAMDRAGRIYVATATRLYCIGDGDALVRAGSSRYLIETKLFSY